MKKVIIQIVFNVLVSPLFYIIYLSEINKPKLDYASMAASYFLCLIILFVTNLIAWVINKNDFED